MNFSYLIVGVFILCCSFPAASWGQDTAWRRSSGWTSLEQELGLVVPNGSDVVMSQVEAPTAAGGYIADAASAEFLNPNKEFTNISGTSTAVSGHANGVAASIYGNNTSVASGVSSIFQYDANDWVNTATGIASGTNPAPQPYDVQNHSWIANGIPAAAAINVLERVDYMATSNNMSIVVGVGNIYASESLFQAGIRPTTSVKRISRARFEKLATVVKAVLSKAITAGGTTLNDFTQADGKPGYFAQELQVYGRDKEPCNQCGTIIKSQVIGQRNTFYCTQCQTF